MIGRSKWEDTRDNGEEKMGNRYTEVYRMDVVERYINKVILRKPLAPKMSWDDL